MNIPVIIALEGPQGNGKTTTINIVFNNLIKTADCFIFQDRQKVLAHDFFAILEKKGKKVGISSYGDSVPLVRRKLDFFANEGCSINYNCMPSRTN